MLRAVAWSSILVALCGCAAAPRAPELSAMSGHDGRCAPAAGGVGLTLDGRCLPVALVDADPRAPEPGADDHGTIAAIARAGCFIDSNVVVGDGAELAHATCGGGGFVPGFLFRVGRDGAVSRVAVPTTAGARLTFLPGGRPRVVLVMRHGGTMVFDARSLDGLAGWKDLGGWGNARSSGPSLSPDGAWLAIPEPYRGDVALVRVADLTLVASLHFAREELATRGPARIEWSPAGLRVLTCLLPYE
jgi:hypothetical protein